MNLEISRSEKLDIFLALANKSSSEKLLKNFSSLNPNELEELKQKVEKFHKLSADQQKLWQAVWLEKLKNRGETQRLDENIHSEQISEVLKNEPSSIQKIILEKLPQEKTSEISNLLNRKIKSSEKRLSPKNEVFEIVRRTFLSNFVAFESLYQPDIVDEFSAEMLERFVEKIAIRETAISCRGIKTKENLAVFLKPFEEETLKEIALKIKELEEIDPLRVLQSEKITGKFFQGFGDYREKLFELGLYLLAMTFAERDDFAVRFTAQKMPLDASEKFENFVREFRNSEMFPIEIGQEILELTHEFKENREI